MTLTAFRRANPNVRTRGIGYVMTRNSPNTRPQIGRFQLRDCDEVAGVVSGTGNPSIKRNRTF